MVELVFVCSITVSWINMTTSVINPFTHNSDIMKIKLGHIKTATMEKTKLMIFLISGKSYGQESDDINDVIKIHRK